MRKGDIVIDDARPPRRRFLTGTAVVAGAALIGSAVSLEQNAAAASPAQPAGATGPKVLRTPNTRFAGLPDYPFEPN